MNVIDIGPSKPDDPMPVDIIALAHDERHLRRKVLESQHGMRLAFDLPHAGIFQCPFEWRQYQPPQCDHRFSESQWNFHRILGVPDLDQYAAGYHLQCTHQ